MKPDAELVDPSGVLFKCSEVPLLPACGGYCPKKWDDGDVPCPAFKYNIEQRLLLAYAIGRLGGAAALPGRD